MMNYAKTSLITQIISFSDNCHCNGSVYRLSGFDIDATLPPGYYVSDGTTRWRKEKFRKSAIRKNYPSLYRDDLTETQLLELIGVHRVWDAGKVKWIKRL